MSADPAGPRTGAPAPKAPVPLAPFVLGAVWLSIVLGASTGAWTLFELSNGWATLASHRQLHAHVQILGLCGLFVLGVSFRALPRLLGAAEPSRGLAVIVLAGIGGGVILRSFGQPLAPWAAGRLLSLASGALEIGGALAYSAWALPLVGTRLRRSDAARPVAAHVGAGVAWLAVTVTFAAVQALWLAGHADADVPALWNEPFYSAGLFGFLLSFVFGFGSRMIPAFLGIRASAPGSLLPVVLASQSAGVLLTFAPLVGAIPDGAAADSVSAGGALVAVAALLFVLGHGLHRRGIAKGAHATALRLAIAFLLVWSVVTLTAAAAELAGHQVHKLIVDGARHLFTIGFLVLLLMAIGARLVPALASRAPVRSRLFSASVALVAAGALLRALQIPVALGLGGLPLYRLAGISGFVVLSGLVGFAVVLQRALRSPRA